MALRTVHADGLLGIQTGLACGIGGKKNKKKKKENAERRVENRERDEKRKRGIGSGL